MSVQKTTPQVQTFQTVQGYEFPINLVTHVGGTIMRESGSARNRKTDFIVYVDVAGEEYEGIIASNRIAADAYRRTILDALKAYEESKKPAPEPASESQSADSNDENRKRAMRACFAMSRDLFPRDSEISQEDAWGFLMKDTGKVSRRELSEKEMVRIEAKFRACQDSQTVKDGFVTDVKLWKRTRNLEGADQVGTGNPEFVRVFSITKNNGSVHTLIEQKKETRGNVLRKCEDFADKNGVDLLIVYPGKDTSNTFIEYMDPAKREEIRETFRRASKHVVNGKCTRCGSVSCSGGACGPVHVHARA